MPDVRELGRRVKAKYPGAYNDLDDGDLGRRVKAKYPGAYDDFTDTPAAQPTQGVFESFQTGVAGPLLRNVVNTAADVYNRPLETLERAGRGALEFVSAFDPAGAAYEPTVQSQAARVAELQRRAEAERPETVRLMGRGMQQLEAEPRTRAGRIAFGTGRVLGEVAFPTAPETAVGNIIAVPFGGAAAQAGKVAFRASVGAVRRTLGKGAAQVIEAEAAPAAVAQVRPEIGAPTPLTAEVPPVAGEAIPSPVAPVVDPLQSTFAKLGTDNVDQIGAMLANANRRLGKKRTPEQIQSSMDDYKALNQLTPDERRALGQVLPMRNFAPITPTGTARDIQNIPMSEFELDPQGAANLRHAMSFFDEQGRALQAAEDAAIMGDIGPGATSGQFGAQPARVSAADLTTTPPPTTPSTIGDRIRMMARTPTSPVLVSDVRRQFPGVGKKEFDDEMVRLVEEGQIALHRHDAPGQLLAAERDAMVKIGDNYFTAATLRETPRIGAEAGLPAISADLGISRATPTARAASAGVAGPRVGADLELTAAAGGRVPPPPFSGEVPTGFGGQAPGPQLPIWPPPPLPPGGVPTGFGGQPPTGAAHLFDYAPSLSRLSHIWQRTKDELFGALGATKSLKSSYDISYPFRQGSLLLLRPLQWRQATKTWESAFKGFRTKNFEEIKQAIEFHPLAKRMEDAGLYRGTVTGEEAFPGRAGSKISEVVEKTPGIKHSQQAFTAAADTQRVQAFEQYARAIDRAGLSTAEALKADKAAAQWINFTTGRGSLGQKIDRTFDALNLAFFSPRYIASRLNILNPIMYGRNLMSPGGRVVLRQQMADLAQFTGVIASTLYLAKQAGADVGLNPESPDFLKIRFGNHRYDTLAGLQQVIRAGYRISADIARAARGEKPKFGESAIDIGQTFLSYKLAPPASVFKSFIEQRTPGGKDFTAGRAVADLVAPIQWADFVDAWRDESFGAALKTLPGAVGIGANRYELDPVEAALDRNRPLLAETQRLNIRVAELQRGKDKQGKPEPDDRFNARIQQFGQNYTSYGLQLIQHPRFQIASDEVKARALKRLNEKAKGLTHKQFAFPELELDPGLILDSVQK